ncbi:MAG: hypothetical protein EA394_02190 [Bacteroidia bacterium]|nr:MAG: hypothetical protein EA394_02190 [Bacteroidia bacterium]
MFQRVLFFLFVFSVSPNKHPIACQMFYKTVFQCFINRAAFFARRNLSAGEHFVFVNGRSGKNKSCNTLRSLPG